jgi:predicted aspartyl protease
MRNTEYKNEKRSIFQNIAILIPLGTTAFLIYKADLTSIIFNQYATTQVETTAKEQYQEIAKTEANKSINMSDKEVENRQEDNQYPQGTIFQYTNKNGLLTMTNDIEKVPIEYRKVMKTSGSTSVTNTTLVEISNNQIHVPVSITYRGQTINTKLLLDTGATGITISPALAKKLGANPTSEGFSTLADGRKIQTYIFACDKISVGTKQKESANISIIPRSDNEETGLLGMSFLADFPHTIDIKSKTIKWL